MSSDCLHEPYKLSSVYNFCLYVYLYDQPVSLFYGLCPSLFSGDKTVLKDIYCKDCPLSKQVVHTTTSRCQQCYLSPTKHSAINWVRLLSGQQKRCLLIESHFNQNVNKIAAVSKVQRKTTLSGKIKIFNFVVQLCWVCCKSFKMTYHLIFSRV